MRQTQRTSAVIIGAMIGAAGLALGASAQDSEAESTSRTTISASGDGGSYEIQIENGELKAVKVDGKKVDLDECDFDKEAGILVLRRDGESFVVRTPSGLDSNTRSNRILISGRNRLFTGQQGLVLPSIPGAPSAIQWAEVPNAPQLPGTIYYDDGQASSWQGLGDEPRVMIGITHDEVDKDRRDMFDLDEGEGVYIIEVREGLPADKAGVRAGDVIIEVDGEHIDDRDVLADVLENQEPGDKLRIVVLRTNDDGDVIKKKLKLKLAEYNGFVLRGGENEWNRANLIDGEWLQLDGDGPKFPDGEDFMFFNDFDFEMPEGVDDLPDDVRNEVMRALELAREQSHNTRARAFGLTINRDGKARAMQERARDLQHHARELQDMGEAHEQRARDRIAQLREEGFLPEPMTDDRIAKLREEGYLPRAQNEHGLERLHEHLGALRGLEMNEQTLDNLREHGVDIQIRMNGNMDRLRDLGLKLHELGGNEQLIRSAPNGRAFLIEREARQDVNDQADQRRDRSSERRLRTERDTLLDRNRSLESRVEALERTLAELMERLEERD
ncbi:MAG: hypothetical protein COB69_09100 [Phycisphaera sp.]|nr:MAG: hypothetical protein COB69_09100 [Phycisphaera sp.]